MGSLGSTNIGGILSTFSLWFVIREDREDWVSKSVDEDVKLILEGLSGQGRDR